MIGQDHQLVLYHCGSLFHRQILVIAHDTVAHGNTRHQADHQYDWAKAVPLSTL